LPSPPSSSSSSSLARALTFCFPRTHTPADPQKNSYFESLMFLVEQAHWYYEDHVREPPPPPSPARHAYRSYSLRDFAALVFAGSPELQKYSPSVDAILGRFRAFKRNVPVMGAALLDARMERVLLVKGLGSGAGWGFPRGKVNQGEADAACAAREVAEETGIDIEGRVVEEDHVEMTVDGKRHKLFIVPGLDPAAAAFAPKCKGEIGAYAWHRLADLPASKEEASQTYVSPDGARHKFFMVWPFVRQLRRWVRKHGGGGGGGGGAGGGADPEGEAARAAAAAYGGGAGAAAAEEEDLWDMPSAAGTMASASGGGGGPASSASGGGGGSVVPLQAAPPYVGQGGAAPPPPMPMPPQQQQQPPPPLLLPASLPPLPAVPVPPLRFAFDRTAIMQALG
jgi:8-oxo-dGTP pyrophosphatase MutT (NUDIX family)